MAAGSRSTGAARQTSVRGRPADPGGEPSDGPGRPQAPVRVPSLRVPHGGPRGIARTRVLARIDGHLLSSALTAETAAGVQARSAEAGRMAKLDGRDRRRVAVVITADGRRVNMPVEDGLDNVPFGDVVRSLLLGLDSLLGLIAGSRRENGGKR